METIEITSRFLEILDPFLRLLRRSASITTQAVAVLRQIVAPYLTDHHMAIESALPERLLGSVNVGSDHCHNGCAKGDVRDEVTVHDVNM